MLDRVGEENVEEKDLISKHFPKITVEAPGYTPWSELFAILMDINICQNLIWTNWLVWNPNLSIGLTPGWNSTWPPYPQWTMNTSNITLDAFSQSQQPPSMCQKNHKHLFGEVFAKVSKKLQQPSSFEECVERYLNLRDPVDALRSLVSMQQRAQHERTGPNAYPQYFVPNILK